MKYYSLNINSYHYVRPCVYPYTIRNFAHMLECSSITEQVKSFLFHKKTCRENIWRFANMSRRYNSVKMAKNFTRNGVL